MTFDQWRYNSTDLDQSDFPLQHFLKRLDITFISCIFLIFFVISSFPYFYGYWRTPPGKTFIGLVGWDIAGSYMYFMWEKQAVEGSVLLENRLTPEEHKPFYFNIEWWLLGRMNHYFGLSTLAGFHVERFGTVLGSFLVLYYFVSCFFQERCQRRSIFLWIILTSGFGWVFWLLEECAGSSWNIRVWDIEGVNLFGYLINKPHVIRSLAMICLSYSLLLRGEQSGHKSYFLGAGLAIVLQGFIRPYDLPTAFFLLLLFPVLLCLKDREAASARLRNFVCAALTAVPIYLYYVVLRHFFVLKDAFQAVDFAAFTPLELVTWLGFPFLIMAAAFEGLRNWREWDNAKLFLYLWYAIVLTLIYAYPLIPWGMESAGLCYIVAPILAGRFLFQDGFPRLLATGPVHHLANRFRLTQQNIVIVLFVFIIVAAIPSNVILFGKVLSGLAQQSRPYYIPTDVAEAFQWMEDHARRDDVVMSHPGNGYHLPVDAGVRAFVGHGHFTIRYQEKVEQMLYFYSAAADDAYRRGLLKRYGIDYVLFSELERAAGAFDPDAVPYLTQVYSNSTAAIYQVMANRL